MKYKILFSTFAILSSQLLAITPKQIDQLTNQWLNIEQQTQQIENNWKLRKPVLIQQVALLEAEKRKLKQLIKESKTNQDNVNHKREALFEKQAALEEQQQKFVISLEDLNQIYKRIIPNLPPLLAKKWKLNQSADTSEEQTNVKLQELLDNLITLAEFEQRISLHESIIEHDTGKNTLVKQLYLGAGIAWFSNQDGSFSGRGMITPEGWQWLQDPNINADTVLQAINMFEKNIPAQFISLPITFLNKESIK